MGALSKLQYEGSIDSSPVALNLSETLNLKLCFNPTDLHHETPTDGKYRETF